MRERGAVLLGFVLLACSPRAEPPELDEAHEDEDEGEPHAAAHARLQAHEAEARAAADFSAIPSSDGRLGPDPYRLIAVDDDHLALLLRGEDRVLLLDHVGGLLAAAPTPHDPTDLVRRGTQLLVVGTGEARVARYDALSLAEEAPIELPDALAPRALAVDEGSGAVFVADEGHGRLHELREGEGELAVHASHEHCRGALALTVVDNWLLTNCLVEHRLRIDRIGPAGFEALDASGPVHDGPIWSFELGERDREGQRLVALTGVEDHPLERRDGGFGYIDSFVFIYTMRPMPGGPPSFEQRARINVSELGVVTPKWSRWAPDEVQTLYLAGYATAPVLELRWPEGLAAAPRVTPRPGLPGSSDALALGGGELLAASPLLDALVRLQPEHAERLAIPGARADDRELDHHLGEALVFTTAMAPWNRAEGKLSRFTCETCHFEGRGDGRVHFTGREREGVPVHASSKPLFGLFPNRPHFSRALDRSTATMVDNEFGVANRHGERGPWFTLDSSELGWLAELPGWPAQGVGGEGLRRALMRFLIRWSMPQNPATRGREGGDFSPLERRGAQLFAARCEGCHEARLAADEPSSRVRLDEGGGLEPWRALIFSANAPIVWASDAYAKTEIRPFVHAEGARVPALRRLYLKWPYFTNGGAADLEEVLVGVRVRGEAVDHALGPAPTPGEGLDVEERAALVAFLQLL